jgi:cell shape-determining protein MreC
MKMSYRLPNRSSQKKSNKGIIVGALVILVLVLLSVLSFTGFNTFTQWIINPFWKAKNTSVDSGSGFLSYFQSKAALERENSQLKERAELLRLEVLNTRNLQQENEELKTLLGREAKKTNKILALVLLKPSFSPYDTLVIDAGADLQISTGDQVEVSGIPIGIVAEVYPHSSLVRLYSSAGNEFPVYIGTDHIEAMAKGQGGNNFMVTLPRESKVQEGDYISIPQITANTFALVNEVLADHDDSFQNVYFSNPVNIYELKWVEIRKLK